MTIMRNTYFNGTLNSSIQLPGTGNFVGSIVTDTAVLQANCSYTYTVTPYNALGVNGTPVTTAVAVSPSATLITNNITLTSSTQSTGLTTLSFTMGSNTSFFDASMALITNNVAGNFFVYNPNIYGYTYSDTSSSYIGGVNYSYIITPRNAIGKLGTSYTTNTVSPPVNSVTSTKNVGVIDTFGSSLVMYYPFEFIPSAVRVGYTPKYAYIVDPSSLMMYYGFDV